MLIRVNIQTQQLGFFQGEINSWEQAYWFWELMSANKQHKSHNERLVELLLFSFFSCVLYQLRRWKHDVSGISLVDASHLYLQGVVDVCVCVCLLVLFACNSIWCIFQVKHHQIKIWLPTFLLHLNLYLNLTVINLSVTHNITSYFSSSSWSTSTRKKTKRRRPWVLTSK